MTTEKIKRKRQKALKSLDAYALPDFDTLTLNNENYESLLVEAFNYANYAFEPDQLKQFTLDYNREYTYKGVPIYEFIHVGKLCWLLNQGVEFTQEKINELNGRLQELEEQYSVEEKPKQIVPKTSVKVLKTNFVLSELELLVDNVIYRGEDKTSSDFMSKIDSDVDINLIKKYFQTQLDDLNDASLTEAYSGWTKPELKKIKELFAFILDQLNGIKAVQRARKPTKRKPRKINPTNMVRKLKYLREFEELKLKSIPPEKIIGAKVLWVYNTKTRKLGQYVAKSDAGLSLKGSTVLDFDETSSVCKRLRKPEEILPQLIDAGKVTQRTFLDNIKAVASPMTGRINADTILVKV